MELELKNYTLGLKLPTDPRWANIAEMNIEDILVDHAYCEQKAATSCISLIVQYPDKEALVDVMTPVVAEEWSHFERVLEQLKKRGMKLGKPRKDEYVIRIQQILIKGGKPEERLVDKLLLNALIEARSCERFKNLHLNIADEELKKFYFELMVSEAGHYRNFLALAKEYMSEEYVMNRWQEFLEEEAKIISTLEVRGDRMH
ncbi:tRNA-(ms[2]io[6]A)-hydroxylase [Roseivirga pacifica]|uniref:tRNA-(ms[2]io[6]A)-hydroxylase n=1 Tax=Roseivirga pacifica TaxID=1267423 RepID=UPI002095AB2D|nr:tRNA-(ms[2]io[6]A)-hydroxylase [Roseivirga pacifica]MCO6360936.1 tRNA 2-methylthio-N6-isopentenyl adenosine(37) hydroxylase MiaE [Roseivirga pacifica]MCO6368825.1 tRNA 2-methylthio-N6-isopentenyl adenosine(37) hydroxylase MiaE [Roseivirga pacifica]MCO6372969.1 tRNA 2-methylthio-N6-isopentenyl adenosine(37) hydroxylase MiaE [Roseivirga pacifica]MCO6377029.1 tRNA 2-methylthio-N6-isopentenyl adenosine(37) hydroxylase MiaE [Roseivirga pacifica]MCO6377694.1 tRNA 2-methylthio-N6-isopentenyl adeno